MAETAAYQASSAVGVELDSTEMEGKFLTFWTDHQLFGVPIADVVQIVGIQSITTIPDYPSYAKGIINLRGSVIPIIDVRLRFGMEEVPYTERTCIIVTNVQNTAVGFIVDSVEEVTDISNEEISLPPQMANCGTEEFLTGIGKHEGRVVLLLDTSKVLNLEQFSGF